MKPNIRIVRFLLVPVVLALLAVTLPADSTLAHEIIQEQQDDGARQGLFLGVSAGSGGGVLLYKDGSSSITEEAKKGGFGSLRFGYAFSPKFALSLEGFGFTTTKNEEDWEIDAVFLATTFHPCGSGFFLRVGMGVGDGYITHPNSGDKITLDERMAFLFSIGYDWWLNDHMSLGLSLDSMGIDGGGASGFEDDGVGVGGLVVQFNWYL